MHLRGAVWEDSVGFLPSRQRVGIIQIARTAQRKCNADRAGRFSAQIKSVPMMCCGVGTNACGSSVMNDPGGGLHTIIITAIITSPITAFVTWLITHMLESRGKLRFASSGWEFKFLKMDREGGHWYDEKPYDGWEDSGGKAKTRYSFRLQLFNEKAESTGLHRFAIRFTKRVGMSRASIIEDIQPSFGSGSIRNHALYYKPLTELQLPSREWTAEDITGFLDCDTSICEADEVWLVAYTPANRCRRWKVTDLSPRIGN